MQACENFIRVKMTTARSTLHAARPLLIAAAVAYYYRISAPPLSAWTRHAMDAMDAVPTVGRGEVPRAMPYSRALVEEMSSRSTTRPQPLRVAGELEELPCLKWTAEHLSVTGGEVQLSAFRQNSSEFVLARGQEELFSRSRSVSRASVTQREFWAAADAAESGAGGMLYQFGTLAEWGEALQAEAAEPTLEASLGVWDAPRGQAAAAQTEWPRPAANVWAAHAGVVATAHYDPSHNVVIQLQGRKRWLLWAPEELGRLRLHPATHPSRRQTRLPLVGPTADTAAVGHADYGATRAMSLELGPGEMLYVPPYWAHAVLSVTPSVALSVLSPAWIAASWAAAKRTPLPFSGLAAPPRRAVAVARYLRRLLPRVAALRPHTSAAFVRRVYEAGHADVAAPADAAGAGGADAAAAERMRAELGDAACDALTTSADSVAEEEEEEAAAMGEAALYRAATAVSALLATEDGERRFTDGVARELLTGYVDELAAWAVGDARKAAGLLACWTRGVEPAPL